MKVVEWIFLPLQEYEFLFIITPHTSQNMDYRESNTTSSVCDSIWNLNLSIWEMIKEIVYYCTFSYIVMIVILINNVSSSTDLTKVRC